MKRPFAVLALLLPAAAALAGDSPSHPLPPEPPHTAAITPEEFRWQAAWLADDAREGRDTASPGARESALWIASRMKEMGLEAPEGAPGYLRSWDYTSVPVKEECALSLSRPGTEPRSFAYGKDWVLLSGAASDLAAAPVVFAGYGIQSKPFGFDDYAGLDCKGKVVVVFRHEPRETDRRSRWNGDQFTPFASFALKEQLARNNGAAALVVVNDLLNHPGDPLEAGPGGGRPGGIPVLMAGRAFAAEVLRGTGWTPECLQEAIDLGDAPVRVAPLAPSVRLKLALQPVTSDNVCGVLRGGDPALKEEWVVVGAHYDHVGQGYGGGLDRRLYGQIHNGADDNASGTAAMLEIAESFALGKEKTRRSLLFLAFSGEEKGLLGSIAYVKNPLHPVDRVAAMLNLDMVGRYRPGSCDVVAAESGSTLKETVDAAAQGLGLEYRHTNEGITDSDGFSFFRAKVPTIFLFTGLHEDYHRPSDDWWLLNAEGAAKLAEWGARIVRKVADADGRPVYNPVKPQPLNRGNRVVLGVTLSDAPEGKGAMVDGVSGGSPAAAAGMKQGDRIVALGGKEVRDADGLRAALGRSKPGDSVVVKVARGSETVEMTISFPLRGLVFGISFSQEADGKKGALVEDVASGSVAEGAGVKAGDRILSFAGKDVPDGTALPALLRQARPGDKVRVKVLRDGKEIDLEAAYPDTTKK
jgi:hypothetical protein